MVRMSEGLGVSAVDGVVVGPGDELIKSGMLGEGGVGVERGTVPGNSWFRPHGRQTTRVHDTSNPDGNHARGCVPELHGDLGDTSRERLNRLLQRGGGIDPVFAAALACKRTGGPVHLYGNDPSSASVVPVVGEREPNHGAPKIVVYAVYGCPRDNQMIGGALGRYACPARRTTARYRGAWLLYRRSASGLLCEWVYVRVCVAL